MLSYTTCPDTIRKSRLSRQSRGFAGKTLLQTLFFFLLVTQICFAQWVPTNGPGSAQMEKISALKDQSVSHLPVTDTNVFTNTPFPFRTDQLTRDGLRSGTPPIRKAMSPQSQIYVIDSAIVRATWDTTRTLFSFNACGKWTFQLSQKLVGDLWKDGALQTTTYDTNNNVLTDASEFWSNNQWVKNLRNTYTYDAIGNNISCLIEWGYLNEWMISQRETYTYDENRNRLTELSELYQGSLWVNC